jgi:hypothetical protein
MPMPMLDVYIHDVSICLCLYPCVCARVHIHVYVEHRYGHVAWTYKYSKNIRHAARTWTCSVDVDMQLGWPRKWVSTISRNTEFRKIHYWFRGSLQNFAKFIGMDFAKFAKFRLKSFCKIS